MSETAKGVMLAAVRLPLGLVFLLAGISKVADPATFAKAIVNYAILTESQSLLVAQFLPWLEVVLGLAVIVGFFTQGAVLASGCLSLGFGVFVTSALARGLNVECGCFSGASKVSWLHLAMDLALLGLAAWLFRAGAGEHSVDSLLLHDEPDADDPPSLRWWVALGCLLLVFNLGYLVLAGASPDPKMPQATPVVTAAPLTLEPPRLNLGKVNQEDEAQGTVTYTNTSSRTVKITGVKSSCSCTVPKPDKEVLEPGESGTLSIGFHPGPGRGPSHQTVRISIEGRDEPVTLDVEADVHPLVSVEPALLDLEIGKPARVVLKSNRAGQLFPLQEVLSPAPTLQIKGLPTKPGEMPELEAVLTGPLPRPANGADAWTVPIMMEGASALLYVREKPR